ncbi:MULTISPECIES: fimbrial protein [unclassified Leclercia]|uniref:fimbrial protein n=1 Tax=unclassified Leclercia TaxID=2627398 RepID=UPI0020738126|nr:MULTISPECIES: fimbrial protein [unclassified Leclercia]MCM5696310.1 fimbrial protein [Leclercia sp. LTM01]MCM5700488.1 fimbrial protein [Leclercia sp. LTM14]
MDYRNEKNILAVLLTAGSLVSLNALASDGTVQFQGSITDGSCTVDVQNSGASAGTVVLGNVPKSQFTGVGSTAGGADGLASIDISLSGCPTTKTAAYVAFDGEYYNGNNDYLKLADYGDTGVATGVAIKLLDGNGTHMKLGVKSAPITLTNGSANVDFKANYVQVEKDVKEGTANATATLLVTY